jgi:hypothetical protein
LICSYSFVVPVRRKSRVLATIASPKPEISASPPRASMSASGSVSASIASAAGGTPAP